MADILNVQINSATSSYTKAWISAYSATPRTDATGTHVALTVKVSMGSGSSLYTHSSDKSLGRVFTGTLNGHSIGVHVIKRYNLDRWESSTTYTYNISFNIPYSPGTIYANFRIEPQGTGSYMTTSTFSWGTNVYTMSSGYASGPGAPTGVKYNNYTGLWIKAEFSGTYTLAWSAPSAGGTGGVKSYTVYYRYTTSSGWTTLGTTSSTSYSINLASWANRARGSYVYFGVCANNLYGSSSTAGGPYVKRANLPSAPTSVSVPTEAKYTEAFNITWSGASAGDGSIDYYILQVLRLAKGSSTWSAAASLGTDTASPLSTVPSTYTAWNVAPGDQLKFRVYTHNSYGLTSSSYKESGTIMMKGGVMRVRVSGTWREGTAWVRVSGTWREARGVYVRVGGTWREGV